MNAVERELLDLERQYWQALKDKDARSASRLTDYPCVVTDANGVATLDEETYRSFMADDSWRIDGFEFGEDPQVRLLSDDVAVVAYRVREDATVDGKPVSVEAADSSIWVRRDGQWRCAAHAQALTGDPFGRDRRAPA